VISVEDYLWYADTALEGMVGIVKALGDQRANQTPELPGANSPYAILTHCLGVMEFWGGQVIAGRQIERDRDAEFVATGSVSDLIVRSRTARDQLVRDLENFDPAAPPRGLVDREDLAIPVGRTQGGALFHIYEELSQHLGQMEITRDIVMRATT
jgi:hypothetical protein